MGARERLAALSVDLDEIHFYAQIHGLDAPGETAHAIYRRAVPRFLALFARLGVPATFFAIGSDLDDASSREALAGLAQRGHEIGNHSRSHLYDFTRRSRAEIRAEIEGGIDAITRTTGRAPTGFRAPGYTITDVVFEELAALGVAYDSSVFPCPAYYGAKASAIGLYRLRSALGVGKASRSIVDDPRVLSAPADPYRVGTPYYRRGTGLVELPIGVTRGARFPYIGTTVALAGETGARLLTEQIVGRPLVNLELHGIDLADADDDGLAFLRAHQPDLRKTAREKERAIVSAVDVLRRRGYRFVRLDEAARAFGSVGG